MKQSNVDEIIEGLAVKLARTLVVKPGDTLSFLAQEAGVSLKQMIEANPKINPDKIHPGDVLVVPDKLLQPRETKDFVPKKPHTTEHKPSGHFDLEAEVSKAATQHGIDPAILHALVQVESSGNPKADSGVAKGLTQLTPYAAGKVGVKDPFDPIQNLHGGAAWLASAISEAKKLHGVKGTLAHALMIYHAGMPAVQHWINAGSPPQGSGQVGPLTINYAKKILQMANHTA